MADITLTDEQGMAVTLIKEWFSDKFAAKTPFILAGLAGTGKSTIVPYIIDDLGLQDNEVCYCAFTGKAAMVLRQKGLPATTIHSLIYKPLVSKDKNGVETVRFIKNLPEDMPLDICLIVVDEASMVGEVLKKDLESFGIPVLYVGDHGQLPPVSRDQINLMLNPNYRLETIHRQALDNPIIWVANQARLGKSIKYGSYGTTVQKITDRKVSLDLMKLASQILCGKNRTRTSLNNQIRTSKGMKLGLPMPSDKLICLKNNNMNGLINGMTGECMSYEEKTSKLSFRSDEGYEWLSVKIDDNIFRGEEPKKYDKEIEQFDFGYAITVHKSQGSQFQRVLLFEEYLGRGADHNKWLYTAVTRAVDKLIIVGA
jgi:exodeoxyribonuclease-5